MMLPFFVTLVVVLLALFYVYIKCKYSYWTKRGIPGPKPIPLVGNMLETMTMTKHIGTIVNEFYRQFPNDSYVGLYSMLKPGLLVRDPDLIKLILVNEFNSFDANDFDVDEKVDPLFATSPITQSGAKWRRTRGQISPCFTAGKVKSMFPLMVEVCEQMTKYLNDSEEAKSLDGIEVKQVASKYTIDVIASCAFGIDAETFTNPKSEFWEMGQKMFVMDTKYLIIATISMVLPIITKVLSIPFVPAYVVDWMTKIIEDTVSYREKNNIQRNDFLQAMINLKNKEGYDFTNLEMTGHSFTFLTDGFETSATILSFAFYELGKNKEIQERLRDEINIVLAKHNGVFSYDAVQDMEYLEQVIYETMRKYPPLMDLGKRCTKTVTIPGNDPGSFLTIEEGTGVDIPIYSIQMDPLYYPDPETFDPERFTEEAKQARHKFTFLSFGEGPRQCLGMRFALAQTKAGLAYTIKNFNLKSTSKTIQPIEFDVSSFLLMAKGGVWVQFDKINSF